MAANLGARKVRIGSTLWNEPAGENKRLNDSGTGAAASQKEAHEAEKSKDHEFQGNRVSRNIRLPSAALSSLQERTDVGKPQYSTLSDY